MAGEEEKTEGEEEKPKSKMMLFVIIGVVLLLVAGGAGFFLMSGGGHGGEGGDGHEEEEEEHEVHLETYEFDTIIVNLSDSSSFLKVKLLIEFDPVLAEGHHGGGGAGGGEDVSSGLPGALGVREPMIRDAIIHVLASKTAKQVLSPEGKEDLKEELIEAINEASGLDEGPVVSIYFVEFIVQ